MLFERVLSDEEKISLKKRGIVETINDQLKNILHIARIFSFTPLIVEKSLEEMPYERNKFSGCFTKEHPTTGMVVIATHNRDGTNQLEIIRGENRHIITGKKTSYFYDVTFSPEGDYVVALHSGIAYIYRVKSDTISLFKEITSWKSVGRSYIHIISAAINSNGERLASLSDNGDIKIWDNASGSEIFAIQVDRSHRAIAFSSDNSLDIFEKNEEKILSNTQIILPSDELLNPSGLKKKLYLKFVNDYAKQELARNLEGFIAFMASPKSRHTDSSLSGFEDSVFSAFNNDSRRYLELLIPRTSKVLPISSLTWLNPVNMPSLRP